MRHLLLLAIVLLPHASAMGQVSSDRDNGTRWIISVAVTKYQDPGLRDLRSAEQDGHLIAESFRKDVPTQRVEVISMNETTGTARPGFRPTSENIRKAIERLRNRVRPDDQVIVYLAGHGCETARQGSIFFPADTDFSNPASMLVVAELTSRIRSLNARRKMLIIDACRENRSIKALAVIPESVPEDSISRPMLHEGTSAMICIQACSSGQYAYECPNSKLGVLTCNLLSGLNGDADKNGDGFVTTAELLEHLKLTVRQSVKNIHKDEEQMPAILDESNGIWRLARCQPKASKAAPPSVGSPAPSSWNNAIASPSNANAIRTPQRPLPPAQNSPPPVRINVPIQIPPQVRQFIPSNIRIRR